LLIRRRKDVIADFSHLPTPTSFADVSAIGRLAVGDFQQGLYDQVWVAYTEFVNMVHQRPVVRKLLPLDVEFDNKDSVHEVNETHRTSSVFIYEPDQEELLNEIVPRFTALQIYQAILSAQASEHAARMVAMKSASDNAGELINELQLVYNKARQAAITQEISEIVGGAAAV
jgi:F-type H+-transporting ATPase subunit gamma